LVLLGVLEQAVSTAMILFWIVQKATLWTPPQKNAQTLMNASFPSVKTELLVPILMAHSCVNALKDLLLTPTEFLALMSVLVLAT
jgi:hypothetical protein